ncbi:hypothetical protein TNCV_967841 [Trichonephila clavipes]|nr:hypothetical protein TNCV_967841 [Trichonephila clavipes]
MDVEVPCQTTVNVYQRRPVIKHYATSNQCTGAWCSTGLTLGEMGWFVVISGSPPYRSTTVIPPQTETKFIH